MSLVTVSKKRNRIYTRKFDHETALQLRAENPTVWTYRRLAEYFGVSLSGMRRALVVKDYDDARRRVARWQRSGHCPNCGAQTSRISATENRQCRPCWYASLVTSVKTNALRCTTCREWKSDAEFPSDSANPRRRGKHYQCRACGTEAKRRWRYANVEKQRAYDRAYKRSRRAKVAA